MKRTTGKVFALTALSSLLLLASACGQSSGQSPSGSASGSEPAGGNASYTDTYDPDALFQYGMTPAKDSETGKYGYKNPQGTWVIEPQYTFARDFQVNGTAFVRTGSNSDEFRLIDREGNFVSDYIFMRFFDELAFSANGIAVGTVCEADGTKLGTGYFYLEDGEIVFEPREEESFTAFSDDGYAVVDNKAVINDQFEYVIEPQEDYYLVQVSNGMVSFDFKNTPKGYSEYGYMDVEGNIVIRGLSSRGGPFADNGIAVVENQLIDKSGNVVFDVADSHYSTITSNFNNTDWVEVSSHLSSRGGTDFNFINAEGETFFPTDAYEHSHMDGSLAIKNGVYVGPAPVLKDDQGNITGIGGTEDYATVAVNEDMEILYVPYDKGIQDVSAYYSDGYAKAETLDEQRVIVDLEGNIVMEY